MCSRRTPEVGVDAGVLEARPQAAEARRSGGAVGLVPSARDAASRAAARRSRPASGQAARRIGSAHDFGFRYFLMLAWCSLGSWRRPCAAAVALRQEVQVVVLRVGVEGRIDRGDRRGGDRARAAGRLGRVRVVAGELGRAGRAGRRPFERRPRTCTLPLLDTAACRARACRGRRRPSGPTRDARSGTASGRAGSRRRRRSAAAPRRAWPRAPRSRPGSGPRRSSDRAPRARSAGPPTAASNLSSMSRTAPRRSCRAGRGTSPARGSPRGTRPRAATSQPRVVGEELGVRVLRELVELRGSISRPSIVSSLAVICSSRSPVRRAMSTYGVCRRGEERRDELVGRHDSRAG